MIKTQPESVTVFSTEDFVMNCEASGNPSPMLVNTRVRTHTLKHKDHGLIKNENAILFTGETNYWLSGTVTFRLLVQLTSTY